MNLTAASAGCDRLCHGPSMNPEDLFRTPFLFALSDRPVAPLGSVPLARSFQALSAFVLFAVCTPAPATSPSWPSSRLDLPQRSGGGTLAEIQSGNPYVGCRRREHYGRGLFGCCNSPFICGPMPLQGRMMGAVTAATTQSGAGLIEADRDSARPADSRCWMFFPKRARARPSGLSPTANKARSSRVSDFRYASSSAARTSRACSQSSGSGGE